MISRLQLFGLLLICALAVVAFKSQRDDAPAAKAIEVADGSLPIISEEERAHQFVAHERLTRARIAELARMDEKKNRREHAAAATKVMREDLRSTKQDAWSEVISSNWNRFMELREKAAHLKNGETPCTICDGKGYMHSCILCTEKQGVCVACKGTGKTLVGDPCPVCLDTGKCFLCFGSGKMLCPFCNDGMIDAKWPPPPRQMPIY
jgi:hypothetical protein